MEREDDEPPQIDESAPGSETSPADGSGAAAQLSFEDTLVQRATADVLDEGYSPPDYLPSVTVPTPAEELRGESLAERLSEEVPDVDPDAPDQGEPVGEVGGARAGRLVDSSQGVGPDREKDLIADDVGVAGGAASAEEAAVHGFEAEDDDR